MTEKIDPAGARPPSSSASSMAGESSKSGDIRHPAATSLPVSHVALEPSSLAPGADPAVDAEGAPEPGEASPEDARDVLAAREGDHEAFARIYDRHAAVVLLICRRHAGPNPDNHLDADDALQETFIRAYRLLGTLESPGRLRSWLFGIARRVCSERRRAAGRRRRHEESAMTLNTTRTMSGDGPGVTAHAGESAAQNEQLERLSAAMDALPDAERLALHLYYLDADPVRAAEDVLGLSRSGYYKLLARAREHLAARLQEALDS